MRYHLRDMIFRVTLALSFPVELKAVPWIHYSAKNDILQELVSSAEDIHFLV